MANYSIPFNYVSRQGKELEYVAEAIASGHTAGDGPFTRRCHELLRQISGARSALLTTSCTHALDLAAILIDVGPGDEVIVPSFTFSSTANAFALRGARVVFADIRRDTLNLDERQLDRLITPRTRAIVPVHYAGVACAMDEILAVADRHGLIVVEDNAQGLFGKYRGRSLGTLGALGAHSFHETKNVSCGEGGALFINRDEYLERAEIVREKGTDRSRYFRGQVDKYSWVDIGSSYLPSEMAAAFLLGQLEAWESVQNKRCQIWSLYERELAHWATENGVRLPIVPAEVEQAYHLFYLLMPSLEVRQRFISWMKSRGILSVFHYVPLHNSDMGRRFGGKTGDCPITESVSEQLVRLPFYTDLRREDQCRVIEAVRQFSCG